MLAAGKSDEFDDIDMYTAPAFCRVDFINAQISKELVNVVDDWYKGRRSPVLIPELYYWFKKRRRTVAEIFEHWLLLSWVLTLTVFAFRAANEFYQLSVPVYVAGVGVFLAVYSLRPVGRISNIAAGKIFNSLKDLEGSRVVFEFTSGDRKRIADLRQENRKQGKKFVLSAGWNLALNILASIMYGYLFATSGA